MKKTALTITLTLLLLSVAGVQFAHLASANFFPDPGPDLPRIYIKGDGSVEPDTAPIERAGNTYRLTADIALQTIVIERDNIVLNGSGYSIVGNSSWMGLAPRWGDSGNNGVIISGQNNVNITNLKIEKFTAGIRIAGSSSISIVGNNFKEGTAVYDTPMGIVIEASSNVLIENNNFTKINGPAIACNGTNITIKGNTLTDINDGVDGSIALQGASNSITDNKIETASISVRLGSADSNIIARNHITGSISLVSSSNNIIYANNLTGIRLIFSSNNTLFGNYMTRNLWGDTVDLDQGTANTVFYGNHFATNDSIRINDAGITLWDNGTIGNYWDDYNGTDANGDGIGDTPHIITAVKWSNDAKSDITFEAGQDNYPLMAPFDVESGSISAPQATTPLWITLTVAVVAVALIVGGGWLLIRKKRHA